MAAADLYLFMDDMLHVSRTSNTLTASSTASGYAIDNAREADLVKAWKPANGASDEYLEFDPATDSDVGTSGETIYYAYAYDARNSDQNAISLSRWDGALNNYLTASTDKTAVNCFFGSFVMPATPYQRYRLTQLNGNRSPGTTTAKIFSWAIFNQSDVIRLSLDYVNDTEATYSIGQTFRVALGATGGGHTVANEYAKPGQRFSVSFGPGSRALWERIRDDLVANGGTKRAIYVQKTGLKNPAKSDFFMCRISSNEWTANLPYLDQYSITLEFETLPWL